MKLYLVILEDRHVDVLVYPYLDKDKAIARAKELACEMAAHHPEYPHQEEEISGWLYYAQYGSESDCVRVIEAEAQDAPPD